MKKLTIDFETRSCADLKKFGAARYAQDPTTEVICLALKWHGQDPVLWYSPNFRSGVRSVSDDTVKQMVSEADILEAHNAGFEVFIWKYVMPRYGFAMFDVKKLRCSLAKAAMYGLPRSLEQACEALGVAQQKDKEGSRLMMRLCKPRRALKQDKLNDPDWETRTYWYGTPEEFARLGEYCMQDVRAEESLSSRLPDLPEAEQKVWQLDLAINDRGVRVDAEAAQAVLDCINTHSGKLAMEFARITGLSSPAQRDATLRCLLALGVQMEGLRAKDVEDALATTESQKATRILEIRRSLSKTSTAKYITLLGAKMADERLRGMFMYHGAGTDRWTGRIVQLQNLPRGTFSDVDWAIELFRNHDLDMLSMFYGDVMSAAATCLRGMLIPAEGHDFVCADYSSIEGRVLAWLAGEESALDVYRSGRDPYKVAAAAIYHTSYDEVTKAQRQRGKVAELACGYQGSVNAFNAMAVNYGVNLPEDEVREIVGKWRDSRPVTVRFWYSLEKACTRAVEEPGSVWTCGKIRFKVSDGFLKMRLPSGRVLWYANPRIALKEMSWGEQKAVVAFDGVNSITRKWGQQYLYGGLLAENATQATARDLLVNGMFAVEAAGYPIVLHVHDELVAEVPEGFGSVGEFEKLMCRLPDWGKDIPVKAEGWRGKRYKK